MGWYEFWVEWFVEEAIGLHGWNEMETDWLRARGDHYPLGWQGIRTGVYQVQGEALQGLAGVTCPVVLLGWEGCVLLTQ